MYITLPKDKNNKHFICHIIAIYQFCNFDEIKKQFPYLRPTGKPALKRISQFLIEYNEHRLTCSLVENVPHFKHLINVYPTSNVLPLSELVTLFFHQCSMYTRHNSV